MALRRRSILQAATEGEKRRNALLSRPLAEVRVITAATWRCLCISAARCLPAIALQL